MATDDMELRIWKVNAELHVVAESQDVAERYVVSIVNHDGDADWDSVVSTNVRVMYPMKLVRDHSSDEEDNLVDRV